MCYSGTRQTPRTVVRAGWGGAGAQRLQQEAGGKGRACGGSCERACEATDEARSTSPLRAALLPGNHVHHTAQQMAGARPHRRAPCAASAAGSAGPPAAAAPRGGGGGAAAAPPPGAVWLPRPCERLAAGSCEQGFGWVRQRGARGRLGAGILGTHNRGERGAYAQDRSDPQLRWEDMSLDVLRAARRRRHTASACLSGPHRHPAALRTAVDCSSNRNRPAGCPKVAPRAPPRTAPRTTPLAHQHLDIMKLFGCNNAPLTSSTAKASRATNSHKTTAAGRWDRLGVPAERQNMQRRQRRAAAPYPPSPPSAAAAATAPSRPAGAQARPLLALPQEQALCGPARGMCSSRGAYASSGPAFPAPARAPNQTRWCPRLVAGRAAWRRRPGVLHKHHLRHEPSRGQRRRRTRCPARAAAPGPLHHHLLRAL